MTLIFNGEDAKHCVDISIRSNNVFEELQEELTVTLTTMDVNVVLNPDEGTITIQETSGKTGLASGIPSCAGVLTYVVSIYISTYMTPANLFLWLLIKGSSTYLTSNFCAALGIHFEEPSYTFTENAITGTIVVVRVGTADEDFGVRVQGGYVLSRVVLLEKSKLQLASKTMPIVLRNYK